MGIQGGEIQGENVGVEGEDMGRKAEVCAGIGYG